MTAYKLLSSQPPMVTKELFSNLWECKVPVKVAAFVWKLMLNGVSTKVNLVSYGITLSADQ
jgi:hypothetical protein